MTTIGFGHSNGRKDDGFKYFIKYVPSRIGDAIETLEDIVKTMKKREADMGTNPKSYNLKRKSFKEY